MSRRASAVARFVCAGGVVGATFLAACLDATPVVVPEVADSAPSPIIVGDSAVDALDATSPRTCVSCLEQPNSPGPGCHNELAACDALAGCKGAFQCLVDLGCTQYQALEQFLTCAVACIVEAGIVSYEDPAAQAAYQVFSCAVRSCGADCHWQKAQ